MSKELIERAMSLLLSADVNTFNLVLHMGCYKGELTGEGLEAWITKEASDEEHGRFWIENFIDELETNVSSNDISQFHIVRDRMSVVKPMLLSDAEDYNKGTYFYPSKIAQRTTATVAIANILVLVLNLYKPDKARDLIELLQDKDKFIDIFKSQTGVHELGETTIKLIDALCDDTLDEDGVTAPSVAIRSLMSLNNAPVYMVVPVYKPNGDLSLEFTIPTVTPVAE